ncbi:MAG TPA: hypothetical protein VKH19_00155 [Gemmatimonadaceae bacterium]|nr:hypothetical protein [Gemmatimonadaceae bacterium]
MATKLQKEIRREIEIDGEPFTVTISPVGVRLTRKRFRSGRELTWRGLWQSGDESDAGERTASAAASSG